MKILIFEGQFLTPGEGGWGGGVAGRKEEGVGRDGRRGSGGGVKEGGGEGEWGWGWVRGGVRVGVGRGDWGGEGDGLGKGMGVGRDGEDRGSVWGRGGSGEGQKEEGVGGA